MKINLDFIYKIFNLKIKLKKESDKKKLSEYEDQIPMYDIYSQKIYPINKTNIHYRLIDSHYRFINEEIVRWLKNLYDKYKKDTQLGPKYKYNLDILENYNISVLIETSYKTLYKYSPQLGLQVSICKRNSFHPYIYHLKPYYTKLELIKLGQNMNLFKKNINLETLIDQDVHYSTCMEVSKNDVSFEEIKQHTQYIVDMNSISWVTFYSFTGSFLFNRMLRTNTSESDIIINGCYKLNELIQNAPALVNDYDIYRFIWDDSFLINLKEGDIFMDNGFTSTTRDPFYSPGLNGNFGLILIKIKIPKNKKGVGLFIENFSLFPKEEEFLLPPKSKLKLLSKNENFKYYHTNEQFEKLINRKYEFELISNISKENNSKENILKENNSKENNSKENILQENNTFYNIETIKLNGVDRIDIIKKFIKEYSSNKVINLKIGKSSYSFIWQWFDATSDSSYKKFYYNKIKDGILFSVFDTNGYPYLNIELGQELVVNYLNTMYFAMYFANNNKNIINNDICDLIYHFGRIFYYKDAIIFHEYTMFNKFDNNIFQYLSLFNNTIYEYVKNNKKYLDYNFIEYKTGYWYLDEYFSKKPDNNIMDKLPQEIHKEIKTNKDLLIIIIEKYFYLYPKIVEMMDRNIFTNSYCNYNIYDRLVVDNYADNFIPSISYTNDDNIDNDYKLIFRQPIRRF